MIELERRSGGPRLLFPSLSRFTFLRLLLLTVGNLAGLRHT